MTKKDFIVLLAKSLAVNAGRLKDETRFSDVEEWDSMAWLTIISAIDERLGFTMQPSRISRLKTVGDLIQYVREECSLE